MQGLLSERPHVDNCGSLCVELAFKTLSTAFSGDDVCPSIWLCDSPCGASSFLVVRVSLLSITDWTRLDFSMGIFGDTHLFAVAGRFGLPGVRLPDGGDVTVSNCGAAFLGLRLLFSGFCPNMLLTLSAVSKNFSSSSMLYSSFGKTAGVDLWMLTAFGAVYTISFGTILSSSMYARRYSSKSSGNAVEPRICSSWAATSSSVTGTSGIA